MLSEENQNRVVNLNTVDDSGDLIASEQQPPSSGNTIYSGVNGLWSTASDYLQFSRMMLNSGSLGWKEVPEPVNCGNYDPKPCRRFNG